MLLNRIRIMRELKGISQKELGEAIGISNTEVSRLENDERRMTRRLANKIAEALGCKAIHLVASDKEIAAAIPDSFWDIREDIYEAAFTYASELADQIASEEGRDRPERGLICSWTAQLYNYMASVARDAEKEGKEYKPKLDMPTVRHITKPYKALKRIRCLL